MVPIISYLLTTNVNTGTDIVDEYYNEKRYLIAKYFFNLNILMQLT